MKSFGNKFFILGIVVLLLISIPLTMYFVKHQQDLRSKAAATSTLSFTPVDSTAKIGDEIDLTVTIDPGENIVSYIRYNLLFDPEKLEAVKITPSSSFPLTLEGPTITSGSATISLGIGADVTKAIQAPTAVAIITFKAKAVTGTQPTKVSFDPVTTQVLSLSASDAPGENVLSTTSPANITILPGDGSDVTPTQPQASPTPPPPTPTTVIANTNTAPVCSNMTISPSASGSAPLAVSISVTGRDTDGTISKATFNYGDGQAEDITQGLGTAVVSPQQSHTYQTPGSYNAAVVFTDNVNAASIACSQLISVSAGTSTGTPSATTAPVAPTEIPVQPTLPPTGSFTTTLGVIGGILVAIIGGVLLFAL